ncbi:MAG: hypothetical protein ACODAJ_11215 [Planctomycetota bacterium]
MDIDQSSRSDAVLVLSDSPSQELLDALGELGLTAVAEAPSVRVFTWLRRRSYEVIVVDDTTPGRDALETVLNIRDYDEDVPAAVLGDASDAPMRDDLQKRLGVEWLDKDKSPRTLARSIQGMVGGADAQQGPAHSLGP